MNELTPEQEIEARMSLAYREAIVQSNRSACVSIHVGQEVKRVLDRLAQVGIGVGGSDFRAVTFHGFPVVEEMAWATEEIRVRSETRIP